MRDLLAIVLFIILTAFAGVIILFPVVVILGSIILGLLGVD